MTDDLKFGNLLGHYRARCGWSQEELAKKAGVSRNAILGWERGERGRQTNTHPRSRGVVLRLSDELLLSKEERKGFLESAGLSIEHWPAEYWNVPYQHNPYFVGREMPLRLLRQRLVPGEKATALTQAISGLGGIGKTQIAVEYVHRYGEQYEAVLWIQADSLEVATAGLLRLATEVLGLPEQQEAEQQIAAVMRWLQKRHSWLLIFDNAEDPQTILSTFVPSKHQGSVLITTRRRDAGVLAHNEIIPLLSEDEAILFLLRRAGHIARNASVTDATSSDFFLARDLCQLLDRLPLALDQAGAYIAENGGSLQKYIDLYHQFRRELLNRRSANDQRDPHNKYDHPASVFVAFSLSWQQIQKRNALAGKMLQFCAFLAPDRIPETLVLAGVLLHENAGAGNDLEIDEAVGCLYRYSLVERTEQTLSLHRLVQDVIQDVLSEEERQYWMERAVLVVNAAFPDGKHGTWSQCEFLLPHALMCAKWTFVLERNMSESARLLGAAGYYLYERNQYKEAEPLLKRSLAIDEDLLGISHPDTAISLNNLAALYWAQDRYEEAEQIHKRALVIVEEQLGSSHYQTAASLNNLAELYKKQGRYREAESLSKRALTIIEEQFGASDPQTAIGLNNLAGLYSDQGRYEEAEPLYQRALHIREELLGNKHPDTAISLTSLGEFYRKQGHYEKAEPLLKRALAIAEKLLGASHSLTSISLDNLAALYSDQGRYEEAEPLHQRALAIAEEQLGNSHPQTATSLNNLAGLYRDQGRYEEAEPLYQRALHIREELLGDKHPDTAISLNNLAALYWRKNRHEEVEPLLRRALAIAEEQLGNSHPQTATSLNNLADLYRDQGRYEEAEPLYQRALHIREELLGDKHPDTAISLTSLGEFYRKQGHYEKAEPLLKRALAIREEQFGVSHPQILTSLNSLAGLYRGRSLYKEAEPLYRRVLAITEKHSHPDTAASLSNLAGLYEEQGRYEEAEPLFQRAVMISQTSLGKEHPQALDIMINYLEFLSKRYTNGNRDALVQLLRYANGNINTLLRLLKTKNLD